MAASRQQEAQLTFAIEVTKQLQADASAVERHRVGGSFPGQLAGQAFSVQQSLRQLSRKTDGHQQQTGKHLSQYLENIERLYQWPKPTVTKSVSHSNVFDRNHYPTLRNVLSQMDVGFKALKSFGTDPRTTKRRIMLSKFIDRFLQTITTTPTQALSDVAMPDKTNTVRDDYQAHIRSLHAALSCHCLCAHQNDSKVITAHLRLKNCCTPGAVENSIKFRLLFLDHPHSLTSDPQGHWQDASICVIHQRDVKFRDSDDKSNLTRGDKISADAFCELITNRLQSQLMLVVSEGGLLLEGPGPLTERFLLRSSSLSLAEVLQLTPLDPKMRLLLSYTLAKAFWQFYGSNWMRKEWTKDTVHFMFEKTSTIPKGILINEPFLSAQFEHIAPPQSKNKMQFHQFPHLLALGIMLIEIELGINIEDRHQPSCLHDNGVPIDTANIITASSIFKNELKHKSDVFQPLKNAIEICMKPDRFFEHQNDAASLREAMMKLIVEPIQKMYMVAWEDPDSSSVSPLPLATADSEQPDREPLPLSPPTPLVQMHVPRIDSGQNHPQSFNYPQSAQGPYTPSQSPHPQIPGAVSEHTYGFSSDVWFTQLDNLNLILRAKPQEIDKSWRESRVAILDTGVEDALDVGPVKDYRDFVDNDDETWRDNVGHGTNAVRLITKVYHSAEIYVARVFKDSWACDNTETLMAKAIHHAIVEWKTDVIVIPSGFRSDHQEILDAINKANQHRVLVFAAASNYGNTTEIAFPGRLYIHNKLFCMFSTDANVRCLRNLNPSPSSKAKHSFAILGENIVLHPDKPPVNGTSFSTMIAGALAARLLDFSRQRGIRESIVHGDRLATVEGMSAVFLKMVNGAVDNGYHCMTPWKILANIVETDRTKQRHEQRRRIRETISLELESLYSM